MADCNPRGAPAVEAGRPQYIAGTRLRNLLSRSPLTDHLLHVQRLNTAARILITRTIIDSLVNRYNFTVDRQRFLFWAQEIVALYRHENRATYFSPYQAGENGHQASGRLWDRYNNLRRAVRIGRGRAVLQPPLHEARDDANEANLLNQLHTVSLDNFERIKHLWERTFAERDRADSITAYFAQFAALRTPVAPQLFEIDYRCMNLSALDIFINKWPQLSAQLLRLARNRKSCQPLLRNTNHIDTEILALKVLPYLFRPKQVTGAGGWRPSYLEQSQGFIQWLNNVGELDGAIQRYQRAMHQRNLTCQPLMYAVGPLDAIEVVYVVINGVRYPFANVIDAVDCCFKSFFALNAFYPRESDQIWSFIETYVYAINVPRVAQRFVGVNSLIADLENIAEDAP